MLAPPVCHFHLSEIFMTRYLKLHRYIRRRHISCFGSLRYVKVAAILERARLICQQIQVNGGAAAYMDKKHYTV